MSMQTTAAPDSTPWRTVTGAVDAVFDSQGIGVNAGQYRFVNVEVLPSGGANPNLEVLFWSDLAGAFVSENVALTKNGIGVDTPFTFTVEANGRIFLVAVKAGIAAAQLVKFATSAWGMNHTL
jgi:hypothetical protein